MMSVPLPVAVPIVAFPAPERLTWKVSFPSNFVSPLTSTVRFWLVVPGADHNDLGRDDAFWQAVAGFLAER